MSREKDKKKGGGSRGPELPMALSSSAVIVLTGAGRAHRFHKERIVLGSVVSSDLRVAGEGISPIHAVLEISTDPARPGAFLYDLASDTGTFVNGKKIVTHQLKSGDSITVGRVAYKFTQEE